MPISKDLFLAILSMDAYNRGYDAGIGSATDGLGSAPGTRIGSAVIKDIDLPAGSEAAGFYALAYEIEAGEQIDGMAAGETVISYRGTDNIDPFLSDEGASDVWQGWITGAGVPGSQSWLAFDFFKAVTGDDALLRETGGVTLTGHSLGGGLMRSEASAAFQGERVSYAGERHCV